MRRLYVPPGELRQGRIALRGDRARYLGAVLRSAVGDRFEIFDGSGARWPAAVASIAPDLVELEVGAPLPAVQGAVDVVLAQALARGDKLDLVVQKATELGASRIVPLHAQRSVVKLDDRRGGARAERWRRIAQEAARQCGRADVPTIDNPMSWDELFANLQNEPERRAVLLQPEAALRLSAAARGASKLLIAVGPEGGFSPAEREAAERSGFIAAGLGPRVLCTETVALAALAVVLHLHGELG